MRPAMPTLTPSMLVPSRLAIGVTLGESSLIVTMPARICAATPLL